MKIAIFHNLPSGGGKRAVFEWVRRLATEHTIDVFTLSTAEHSFCDIRPFVSKYTVYEFYPRSLYKSPLGRLNQVQRWRDLGDLDKLNQKIAEEINAGEYHVLFANTCMFTFVPALIHYIEIPSVYYLHEPFGSGTDRQFERPYLHQKSWKNVIDRFDPFIRLYKNRLNAIQTGSIQKTRMLLANSKFTAERNQAAFGLESILCPLGVDLNDFQPIPGSSRGDFVISVGEMSPRKGFDFIIEGLGKIPKDQRPALKLVCNTVKPEELRFITELAERYDVDTEVLYNMNTNKLREYYNRARLCVYTPIVEPFGLVPLEAMACGTPVVGIREGGVGESLVHGHTGVLVERDPDQFASAVRSLITNPALAETYGLNARDHVIQNWSWDRSVSLLNSQLKTCANLGRQQLN